MKKWICAMLCLSMFVGLASVSAEASTEKVTEKNIECTDTLTSESGDVDVREEEAEQGLDWLCMSVSQKVAAKPEEATAVPEKASATPPAATVLDRKSVV